MAELLAPFPPLPEPAPPPPELTAPVPLGFPIPRLRGGPPMTMQTNTPPAESLTPEELEKAAVLERPWFEANIPRRERSLPGEVISSGFRGAIPGTIGAFGQAAEAVGLPSVGKPLQRAAKTLRQTYPGLFEPSAAAQQPGIRRAIASGVEGLATSLGVSAPTLLATAATGGTGFVPLMAAYILGSPAVLSAASYQQFYDAATKAGVPEDVAKSGALQSAFAEGIPELIGNTLETLLISKGLTKAAAQGIYRKLTGTLGQDASIQAALKPTITATLGNLAATAGVEAGTEGATQVLQQKIAADTGLATESAVGEAMGAGAVAGLIFGLLGRGGARVLRGRDLQTLSNPEAPPEARMAVAEKIGGQLATHDPELGQSFLDFTTRAVTNHEAIPVTEPFRQMLAGQPAPAAEPPPATVAPDPTLTGEPPQDALDAPLIETVVRPPLPGMPLPRQPVTPPLPGEPDVMAAPPIATVIPPRPDVAPAPEPVGAAPEPPTVEPVPAPVAEISPPEPPRPPTPMPQGSAMAQQVAQTPPSEPQTPSAITPPAPMLTPSAAVQHVAQAETPAEVTPTGAPVLPPVDRPRTGIVPDWPVDRIQTDPTRLQFKQGAGPRGATGSLRNIRAYNPNFQGVALVWQDPALPPTADPKMINGHNRLDAAARFGRPTIPVRFIEAMDAAEAHETGALTNIADGKGTIFDAALFFRAHEVGPDDLTAVGVQLSEHHTQQALALANLHPTLFGAALRGDMPPERAVLIGGAIPDQAQQLAFLALIERQARQGKSLTNDRLRELIDFTLNAPTQTTTEETLFGLDARTDSLALDKAELSDYIRKRLRDDKKLFGTVGREAAASQLSQAGNVIDVAGSQARAGDAATALDLYDRLKLMTGPVGDVLNAGASRLGAGESRATVHRDTYDRLLAVLRTTLPGGARAGAAESQGLSVGSETAPGSEPGGGALFSPTPAGTPTGLTLAAVQAVFPGQTITPLPTGGFRVTLPSGFVDLLSVQSISMAADQAHAFQVGYGQPWDPSRTIAGRFTPTDPATNGATIELVQGTSDRITLRHEVQHFLEASGLLTPQDIQLLDRAMARQSRGRLRGTEARAQWVAERLDARDYRRDTAWGQVLDRIWAFFDRLLALAGLQTTRGLIRQAARAARPIEQAMRTGTIFDRPVAPASSALPQFAVAPPQPQVEPQLRTEHKLLVDTMGFLTMATPEIRQRVADLDLTRVKYVVSTEERQSAAARLVAQWEADPTLKDAALHRFRQGQLANSVEHDAWRMLGRRLMDLMQAASQQMPAEEFDLLLKAQLGPNSYFGNLEQLDNPMAIAELQASEYGRGLRAQQDVPRASRIFARLIDLRSKVTMTADEFQDWMARWSEVAARHDPREIEAFERSIREPTLWDYIKELRYSGMLSGWATHVANAMGTAGWNLFNQTVIRGLEGLADQFVVKHLQQRDQERFLSEILPAVTGMLTALNPGGTLGRQRWRMVPAFITGGHEALLADPDRFGLQPQHAAAIVSKFERDVGQHREAWTHARWMNFEHPVLEAAGLYDRPTALALLKRIGIEPGQPIPYQRWIARIVTFSMRALTAMDILNGLAAYDAELAGSARRQAEQDLRAGRLEGQTVAQRTHQYLTQAPDAMHQAVLARVQYLTFMDQVSTLGSWMLQGRELPVFGKPLHFLFPFVATPDRLIARALDLLPGVGLFPHRQTLLHPQTSGAALSALIARQMAGLVLGATGLYLFREGLLTGPPPEDANEREAWSRQGQQPFAVKLGDTWVSYRRFEPLNLVLSLFPTIARAIDAAEREGRSTDVLSLFMYTGAAMTQHVIEGSYFSGIEPILSALQGRTDPSAALGRQLDSLLPFQGLRASTQRLIDAFATDRGALVRSPQAWWHHFAGLPTVTDIPLKYNVWGQPLVTPGTLTAAFLPYRLSTASRDRTESELARLHIYPAPPSKRAADGTLLSSPAYDRLVQTRGHAAKAKLDALTSLPSWPLLSDPTRTKLIKDALRDASHDARTSLPPTGLPTPR